MLAALPRAHQHQERLIEPLPQEWSPRPSWFATSPSLPRLRLASPRGISPRVIRIGQLAIVFGLAVTVALLYLLLPAVHAEVDRAMATLAAGDGVAVGEYLRGYGIWAPLASVGLMVVQAVAAPVPAVLIAFANGLAFGVVGGGLLTVAGQSLAAIVCFAIARSLGRAPVEALAGRFGLAALDAWVARRGGRGIFLLRLVPGVSFDVVSYAAGLTGISFRLFLAATTAGVAPQAFLYAYLIREAPHMAWAFYLATWLFVGVAVTALAIRSLQSRAHRDRGDGNEESNAGIGTSLYGPRQSVPETPATSSLPSRPTPSDSG